MEIQSTARGAVLSELCTVATVSISRPSNEFDDEKLTDIVLKNTKAERGSVSADKKLFDADCLRPITRAVSNIRKVNYRWTFALPETKGIRLLPNKVAEQFLLEMNEAQADFSKAVKAFVSQYHRHVLAQQPRLNGAFDAEQYINAEEFEERHAVSVTLQGLPSVDGIQAGQFTEEYQQAETDRQAQAVTDITDELGNRLSTMLRSLAEKLGDINKKGSRFSESHFANLVELVEQIIPVCNIADDERINDLAEQVSVMLRRSGTTPEGMADVVKSGSVIRNKIKAEASDIASKASSLFG